MEGPQMARLQVIALPDSGDGPPRYALLVDQLDPPLTDDETTIWNGFAATSGAVAFLATVRRVDVDQPVEVDWPEEFAGQMRHMIDERIGEHLRAAAQPPSPDLSTAEGRAARTWGGQPPLKDRIEQIIAEREGRVQ
jgi:hypothetical protein